MSSISSEQIKEIAEIIIDIHEKNTRDDRKTLSNTVNDFRQDMVDIKFAINNLTKDVKNINQNVSDIKDTVKNHDIEIKKLNTENDLNKGSLKIISFLVIPLLCLIGSMSVWIFFDKINYLENLVR